MPKRVLVFQHLAVEHPGIFRDFLAADGHVMDVVELDEGGVIPPLEGYDALWVMGGPMDVWEEAAHPWLAAEKAAIRAAVGQHRLPYLGFCLGHQLLGEAMGGRVGLAAQGEVGIMPVHLDADHDSPFLRGLPPAPEVLQWHGAEVSAAPPAARVLAHSPRCAVQAMSIGTHAFSMQFHVEITDTTVTDWAAIPAYAAALARALGEDGAAALFAEATRRMPEFNACARQLYANWAKATGFAR